MKTYDNTIKYYELLMTYEDTSKYMKYELPSNYKWEYYKPGDEEKWIDIHISSREFTSHDQGLEYFHTFYDSFKEELPKRLIFIVDKKTNEYVGTLTISKVNEDGYLGAVDWLAIKEEYQGKGLSKPLISKTIELSKELNIDKIILHTQTTTWLAAKLYLDYGYEIYNTKELTGWSILKSLTNHPKLQEYQITKDIYDKRNIEIERQLKELYNTEDFNYSVWYKNNQHTVYSYVNKMPHEYKYYEENGTIRLEEVESKYKK